MTGRERVIAALERKVPDRVPTLEWVLSPKVMAGIVPRERSQKSISDIEFVEEMDMDGIALGLGSKTESAGEGKIRDEWGVVRVLNDDYLLPVGANIVTMDDCRAFTPPEPLTPWRFDKIKAAIAAYGGEANGVYNARNCNRCVIARVRDVFSQPRDMMGYQEFLISFYEEPELATAMMEMSADYSMKICEGLVKLGIEVIVVGDDIANNDNLLLSPQMFRDYVLPPFKRLVQHAKKLGLKVIKHSDGDLRMVVDDLIDAGIDCLDPIDERGHMNLAEMKAKYGDRIAFKGNVDCVDTLVNKSLDDVKAETLKCLREGSLDGAMPGGHIISSSNSIHSGVNPLNYKCFLDTVKGI
jgi:uroporphyrinogen decarboxylase